MISWSLVYNFCNMLSGYQRTFPAYLCFIGKLPDKKLIIQKMKGKKGKVPKPQHVFDAFGDVPGFSSGIWRYLQSSCKATWAMLLASRWKTLWNKSKTAHNCFLQSRTQAVRLKRVGSCKVERCDNNIYLI